MIQPDLAIPTLPSGWVSNPPTFYQRLGFDGGIHDSGDCAILRRDTVEHHYFTHEELLPNKSNAGCYIRISDAESIYQAFAFAVLPRKGITRMDTLADKQWGIGGAIVDPDGNQIRIGKAL